ncbi:unnamed protein product [Caenorhabditis auriculariae]|uniref:Transcription factor 25 n=1 Tax=Caenorhabditis auriculariae TaxID=2777116 RepID=A0A8S1HSY8_9PELO|nr:unnamed protein product [Caenorhabditis auriculariae]
MSKSQLKRLHEEEERKKRETIAEELDDDDLAPRHSRVPVNRFAFLEEEKSVSDSEKAAGSVENQNWNTAKERKKNKKQKKKNGKKLPAVETEEELLERYAAENKLKNECAGNADDGDDDLIELMKVDPKMFDPSAELKRLLGKALKESSSNSNSRRDQQKPKSLGVTMVHDRDEEDVRWFKFVHQPLYEPFERMFWHAEDNHDVEMINEILVQTGYHLNSLLSIANVMRMQDDFTQSCDFIERGIYFCEQHFAAQFQPMSWKHRIDYLDYENRAFYLLLHRHLLNIVHKRCFETALNVAKLIFKMDPQRDPLAIILIIDTIAINALQYKWLISFYNAAKSWKNLHLLPNMRYSVALAKFHYAKTEKEKDEADDLLQEALVAFPTFVTDLLDELQMEPDPLVETHEHFSKIQASREGDGLKLLQKIYVKQSCELWKAPSTMSWLEMNTRLVAAEPKFKEELQAWRTKRQKMFTGMAPNVSRLAELLGLTASNSITDPVPPPRGRAIFTRTNQAMPVGNDSFWSGLLHSLYPDFDREENLGTAVERVAGDLVRELTEFAFGRIMGADLMRRPGEEREQGEEEEEEAEESEEEEEQPNHP